MSSPFFTILGKLKKHKELIPLAIIFSTACTGAISFAIYSLSKSEVMLDPASRANPGWNRINPEKSQKLITINQEYKAIPELEALKKEMAEAEKNNK